MARMRPGFYTEEHNSLAPSGAYRFWWWLNLIGALNWKIADKLPFWTRFELFLKLFVSDQICWATNPIVHTGRCYTGNSVPSVLVHPTSFGLWYFSGQAVDFVASDFRCMW